MKIEGLIKRGDVAGVCQSMRRRGRRIVFTNGVFDILHRGHVDYLNKAREMGDLLIVGINSDSSVRKLKGKDRPLQSQSDRSALLLALRAVDHVAIFGEQTPEKLIRQVKPHVLVKGADYKLSGIVGAEFVLSYGGSVKRIKLTRGRSTSALLKLMRRL